MTEREAGGRLREKGREGKGKGRFEGIAGGFLSHLDKDIECELHSSLVSEVENVFYFSFKMTSLLCNHLNKLNWSKTTTTKQDSLEKVR